MAPMDVGSGVLDVYVCSVTRRRGRRQKANAPSREAVFPDVSRGDCAGAVGGGLAAFHLKAGRSPTDCLSEPALFRHDSPIGFTGRLLCWALNLGALAGALAVVVAEGRDLDGNGTITAPE